MKVKRTQMATWIKLEMLGGSYIYCCFDDESGSMTLRNHSMKREYPWKEESAFFEFKNSSPRIVKQIATLMLKAAEEGLLREKELAPKQRR